MSENQVCPIWGTPSEQQPFPDRDAFHVDSPRADGRYIIAGSTSLKAKYLDNHARAHLTSWLIEQRRLGEERPEITDETIERAKQRRDLPIYERADRLLLFLKRIEPSLGQTCRLRDDEFLSAHAWTESRTAGEREIDDYLKFFLSFLETRDWIEVLGYNAYSLTVDGYAHLEELEHQDTGSSQAFVAMWFDGVMKDVQEEGLLPAIRDAGYAPILINRKEHVNKIDDEIIAEIRRSRFIVADFTHGDDGARGGVYYEAGFAHGLGIPVIFTCRKNVFEKVHFDTRQYNHIVWETPKELRDSLANRIAAVVGDGPLRAK